MDIASLLVKHIQFPYKPSKIEVVGSLGRGEAKWKDIDLLVTVPTITDNYLKDIKIISPTKMYKIRSCGTYNCYFTLRDNKHFYPEINIFLTDKKSYVFAKLARLRSKGQNIGLRRHAEQKGLKLSQYGLFKGDTPITKKFKDIDSLELWLKS